MYLDRRGIIPNLTPSKVSFMKSILRLLSLLMISSIAISYGCSNKGGGGGVTPPPPNPCTGQATVSATTVPSVGSLQTAATGPDFPLVITLTNVPTVGVSIVVNARPETPAGSAIFFTQTHTTVTGTTDNFTITGTPSGVVCVVDITITSKNCSTNTWTGSYRYSKK
jgi:hypothetical protein